jgi:hypothetical protein
VNSWAIGLYGTHVRDIFFVDDLTGYARTDYDIQRRDVLPLGPAPGDSAVAVATAIFAKTLVRGGLLIGPDGGRLAPRQQAKNRGGTGEPPCPG